MKLLLSFLVLLTLCTGLRADPPPPLNAAQFAFNFGSSDHDTIDDAVASKVYEDVPAPNNSHVVRYLRLETFENSKVTTRARQTVFCYGEATYCPTLPDGVRVVINCLLTA